MSTRPLDVPIRDYGPLSRGAARAALHLDPVGFNFHIDLSPDASPADVAEILARAKRCGYMPLEEDEGEEFLPEGAWRIWLSPIEPVDP